jgi:two-component system chemotaxis response regulator CheB
METLSTPQTGAKTRILVVDDSALMRKMISQIINAQPDMEAVGIARDGIEALEMTQRLKPDLITLDVEMPRMSGIEFLEQVMPKTPQRVLMLSSLTSAGAEATFACLQRGAVDFLAKPSGSISLDLGKIGEELVAKIRGARTARLSSITKPHTLLNTPKPPMPPTQGAKQKEPLLVVAIASSTGGPGALSELLAQLPNTLEVSFVVVQHLPDGFSDLFCQRMNGMCALEVREAKAGERPQTGTVHVAPGGRHIVLDSQGNFAFNDEPVLHGVRPAADKMMQSVARVWKERTVGVVLTGMGYDGAEGVRAIQQSGGISLAQDEATSVIYGMPRAAWETGAVARQVALSDMPTALLEVFKKRILETTPLWKRRAG